MGVEGLSGEAGSHFAVFINSLNNNKNIWKCWDSSQEPPEKRFQYPTTPVKNLEGEKPKNFRSGGSAAQAKGASRGFGELRQPTLFL